MGHAPLEETATPGGDSSAAGYEWDPAQQRAEQMPAERTWIHLPRAV